MRHYLQGIMRLKNNSALYNFSTIYFKFKIFIAHDLFEIKDFIPT